jgi:hypothetical protein
MKFFKLKLNTNLFLKKIILIIILKLKMVKLSKKIANQKQVSSSNLIYPILNNYFTKVFFLKAQRIISRNDKGFIYF